jgi:hypothetical protein
MNTARTKAQQLLEDCGYDEITGIPMNFFVAGLDAILIEEKLKNCDAKIIFGGSKTVIKLNSAIQYNQRKRFAVAHEIGHLILHNKMELPDDVFFNFNIIEGVEKFLKSGKQEIEANEFASELLMPSKLFYDEASGHKFTPDLIKQLSARFNTSLIATAFKYIQMDIYPICIVCIEKGRVRYWKKSPGIDVWVIDYTRLAPPDDSLAMSCIENNYHYIDGFEEQAQSINKSTWFELKDPNEEEEFFEYCILSKDYKTILSIIWQEQF